MNGELFLSNESFQGSLDRLIILPIGSHGYDKEFGWKFLNIIDPLKGDNNLGNSISKGQNSRVIHHFVFFLRSCGAIFLLCYHTMCMHSSIM